MPPHIKQKAVFLTITGLLVLITVCALWRTPITTYKPMSDDERALTQLFIKYVSSRNNRDVHQFLSTLHDNCTYMVTKDMIVSKEELRDMLPALWMQNDDNTAAFGHCMAWECWHENYYKTVMLINPKFHISKHHAKVDFKIVSGLFMDDNYFRLVNENGRWQITRFLRSMY